MVWSVVLPAVLLAVTAVLAVVVATLYNGLVRLRNKAEEAWSGIDVQLQRRADLVPTLVEVVKGYATHERETFEQVTQARQAVVTATGPAEAEQADGLLVAALRRLFVLAEDYPDLQASGNFLALQHQLAVLEEDLSFARRYYNAVVEDLNTRIQTFPSLLVARPFGFTSRAFFEAGQDERTVPRVDLGTVRDPGAGGAAEARPGDGGSPDRSRPGEGGSPDRSRPGSTS